MYYSGFDESEIRYAWVITRDFIADKDKPEGTYANAKGVAGPSTATPEEIAKAKAEGFLFRLRDGDGNIYYHGRLWATDSEAPTAKLITLNAGDKEFYCTYGPTADEIAAFGPLNDFGTPNAGATTIEYRVTLEDGTKVWAVL